MQVWEGNVSVCDLLLECGKCIKNPDCVWCDDDSILQCRDKASCTSTMECSSIGEQWRMWQLVLVAMSGLMFRFCFRLITVAVVTTKEVGMRRARRRKLTRLESSISLSNEEVDIEDQEGRRLEKHWEDSDNSIDSMDPPSYRNAMMSKQRQLNHNDMPSVDNQSLAEQHSKIVDMLFKSSSSSETDNGRDKKSHIGLTSLVAPNQYLVPDQPHQSGSVGLAHRSDERSVNWGMETSVIYEQFVSHSITIEDPSGADELVKTPLKPTLSRRISQTKQW